MKSHELEPNVHIYSAMTMAELSSSIASISVILQMPDEKLAEKNLDRNQLEIQHTWLHAWITLRQAQLNVNEAQAKIAQLILQRDKRFRDHELDLIAQMAVFQSGNPESGM